MDRQLHGQGFSVLRECYFCGLMFANNHRCPAKDEKCPECNEYGHFSGFCQQWKPPLPKAPNNNTRYRGNPPLINTPEPLRRNMLDSIGKNNKEIKQEMTDKTIVNEDSDELMPKKKRFKGEVDDLRKAVALQKKLLEKVKEKLAAAEAKNSELEKSLDCEKKSVARYQAKQNMYRNSALNKTLDKLTDQLKTCKGELDQVKEQRNNLYAYTLKIQGHNDKITERVAELTSEHKLIMTNHYSRYASEDLPSWYWSKSCSHCGSDISHHREACLARDNICRICGIPKHFTAMCNKADLKLRVIPEETNLLDNIWKEISKVDD